MQRKVYGIPEKVLELSKNLIYICILGSLGCYIAVLMSVNRPIKFLNDIVPGLVAYLIVFPIAYFIDARITKSMRKWFLEVSEEGIFNNYPFKKIKANWSEILEVNLCIPTEAYIKTRNGNFCIKMLEEKVDVAPIIQEQIGIIQKIKRNFSDFIKTQTKQNIKNNPAMMEILTLIHTKNPQTIFRDPYGVIVPEISILTPQERKTQTLVWGGMIVLSLLALGTLAGVAYAPYSGDIIFEEPLSIPEIGKGAAKSAWIKLSPGKSHRIWIFAKHENLDMDKKSLEIVLKGEDGNPLYKKEVDFWDTGKKQGKDAINMAYHAVVTPKSAGNYQFEVTPKDGFGRINKISMEVDVKFFEAESLEYFVYAAFILLLAYVFLIVYKYPKYFKFKPQVK